MVQGNFAVEIGFLLNCLLINSLGLPGFTWVSDLAVANRRHVVKARRVAAGRGWEWLVEGWKLFLKAPGMWILMLLIYFAISLVLSFIPFVGSLANTLITPALMGGMVYGAAALARGDALLASHLFQAFQEQKRLGPMLTLGALLLIGYIIIGLVIASFATGVMVSEGDSPAMTEEMVMKALQGVGGVAVLMVLLLAVLLTMAMFYAVPLVLLDGMAPWSAVQNSVAGCFANFLPFLIFGFVYLLLAFLAAIPFGLGFLVLGPVTFGAIYASYVDVFANREIDQLEPPSSQAKF